MQKIILLILFTSSISSCVAGLGGLIGGDLGHKKLKDFSIENHLDFQCVKKQNMILPMGIMLEHNRNIIIERCKLHNVEENDYEK